MKAARVWLVASATPLLLAALAALFSLGVAAQIRTDSSLGKSAQTLSGPNFLIPQTLGKLAGVNLFHSFESFNILKGESANFTTDTAGINNVVSRVTGGSLSQINGQLKLTPASGAPNFYFINPAGVTFGAGASINVPGAFHVSTADYVKFPDGNFYADATKASSFSSAAPEAFGFLGSARAAINLQDGAGLGAKPAKTISIVAGDVELNNASVSTQGSGVRVVALGKKAQEVGFSGALPMAEGNLTILNGASISSSSLDAIAGETMAVSAGTISIDSQGSSTRTGILSNAVAGSTSNTIDVDVMAGESLSITNSGRIRSTTNSSGNAGAVKITAGNINIDGTGAGFLTGVWSDTTGTGAANRVEIAATGNLAVNNSAVVFSDNAASSNTSLSSVKVSAGNISIDGKGNPNGTGIYSDSQLSAGSVEVTTPGQLSISNGGVITSNLFSSGSSGSIRVGAGSIAIDTQGGMFMTGVFAPAGVPVGNASRLSVTADGNLSIKNGGVIYSKGSSLGGGAIPITVNAGNISIDGSGYAIESCIGSETVGSEIRGGNVAVSASGSLSITNGGAVETYSYNSGTAGSITIRAKDATIDAKGAFYPPTGIASGALSTGNSGNVDVLVQGDLMLMWGGRIFSATQANGDAGPVTVNAGNITVGQIGAAGANIFGTGGGIYSITSKSGNTGDINVSARGNISVLNGAEIRSGAYLSSGTGKPGSLSVSSGGNLTVANGGEIYSKSYSPEGAGKVTVSADNISIDAVNPLQKTGIASEGFTAGNGGSVEVKAARDLSIANGGSISSAAFSGSGNAGSVLVIAENIAVSSRSAILSSTYANGDAGVLNIGADKITLDGGHLLNQAESGSKGNAGNISVTSTGDLSIVNGGWISSGTYSSGNAGAVKVNAGSITIDGTGSMTGILSEAKPNSTGNAGSIEVTVAKDISIHNSSASQNGAGISSSTWSSGNAGTVKVYADNILIDGRGSRDPLDSSETGIFSAATSTSMGHAGSIEVTATGIINLVDGGQINSSAYSSGDAGSVKVNAGSIAIDGTGIMTGILSEASLDSTGNAGSVEVTVAGNLSILNGSRSQEGAGISSSTWSSGNAGTVKVKADTISIDGQGSKNSLGFSETGIFSAAADSSGHAGSVEVETTGKLSIVNGGVIDSSAYWQGDAGSVKVSAGSIAIDGGASRSGILSEAKPSSTGNAGSVDVSVSGDLSSINGGVISSSTSGSGNAGSVNVSANTISVDGASSSINAKAAVDSSGQTGSVSVTAASSIALNNGATLSIQNDATADKPDSLTPTLLTVTAPSITLNGGQITAATTGNVAAGNIKISTGNLTLSNGGSVTSDTSGQGKAGDIAVSVSHSLSLTGASQISSSTAGSGSAGTVEANAETILVDGTSTSINAKAATGSSGQTGSVSVAATDSITLANAGELSIRNDATVGSPTSLTPTLLSVTAPVITLKDASITAASTGNVAASSIRVSASDRLSLDPSSITTSANLGNGGSITIQGGKFMTLDNSQITTSVAGLTGNGGDINLSADTLFMNTGFIQANTAARDAAGGKVGIDVRMLVPSGSTLFVGGQTPYSFLPGIFGFNVIQAAAPTGVSGTIQITSPVLDISGSLNGLNTQVINSGGLGRSPCQTTGGSSLAQAGRGGLPPSALGLLRTEPSLVPIKATTSMFHGESDQHLASTNWGCS